MSLVFAYSSAFLLSRVYVCFVTGVCQWARMEVFLFLGGLVVFYLVGIF